MTAPVMSPDTIEEIDYDAAIPCTMKWILTGRPVCDNEAEWILTRRCCGAQKLVCDPCYQRYVLAPWPRFNCGPCGKFWSPPRDGIIAARRV